MLQDFWRYMDILIFVEATIYQMDNQNEALASAGEAPIGGQLQGVRHLSNGEVSGYCSARHTAVACPAAGEQALTNVLSNKRLLDSRLSDQLQQVQLCQARRALGNPLSQWFLGSLVLPSANSPM